MPAHALVERVRIGRALDVRPLSQLCLQSGLAAGTENDIVGDAVRFYFVRRIVTINPQLRLHDAGRLLKRVC